MSRVRLVVAVTAAVMGVALAGCSALPAMPDWAPDWMSSKPPSAQLQNLAFESNPPGADVRTAQGQTCLTPCSISVASEAQSVTFSKIGFIPQTVQVNTGQPPEHAFWESPPPTLVPNPVQVMLQPVPPPPRKLIRKRKPHGSVSRTRTAAKTVPARGGSANPFPDPQQAQPADPAFPPPPTR